MHPCVAFGAQRDQVRLLVVARLATALAVLHLQVPHRAAGLAAPAVALQHLAMEFAVAGRIQFDSRASGRTFFMMPSG